MSEDTALKTLDAACICAFFQLTGTLCQCKSASKLVMKYVAESNVTGCSGKLLRVKRVTCLTSLYSSKPQGGQCSSSHSMTSAGAEH